MPPSPRPARRKSRHCLRSPSRQGGVNAPPRRVALRPTRPGHLGLRGQFRPTPVGLSVFGQIWADFWKHSANLGCVWPNVGNLCPVLPNFGPQRPSWADFGHCLATFGPRRPTLCRHRPDSSLGAAVRQSLDNLGACRNCWGNFPGFVAISVSATIGGPNFPAALGVLQGRAHLNRSPAAPSR